ncbi:hypothetical protein [Burkholderia perseverans]|nr:hypothetical protein [Burkholderia perseverans]
MMKVMGLFAFRRFTVVEIRDAGAFVAELQAFVHERVEAVGTY